MGARIGGAIDGRSGAGRARERGERARGFGGRERVGERAREGGPVGLVWSAEGLGRAEFPGEVDRGRGGRGSRAAGVGGEVGDEQTAAGREKEEGAVGEAFPVEDVGSRGAKENHRVVVPALFGRRVIAPPRQEMLGRRARAAEIERELRERGPRVERGKRVNRAEEGFRGVGKPGIKRARGQLIREAAGADASGEGEGERGRSGRCG